MVDIRAAMLPVMRTVPRRTPVYSPSSIGKIVSVASRARSGKVPLPIMPIETVRKKRKVVIIG